jgi:hypothetical protein
LRRLTKPPKITKPRETDGTTSGNKNDGEPPLRIDEEYIPGYDYKNWIGDVKITFNKKIDV